jgi:hypothetical protein
MKPEEFQEAYVAIRHLPYLRESSHNIAGGGVLAQGQQVWIRSMDESEPEQNSIYAFVEDIGIVALDPRWLRKRDSPLGRAS